MELDLRPNGSREIVFQFHSFFLLPGVQKKIEGLRFSGPSFRRHNFPLGSELLIGVGNQSLPSDSCLLPSCKLARHVAFDVTAPFMKEPSTLCADELKPRQMGAKPEIHVAEIPEKAQIENADTVDERTL